MAGGSATTTPTARATAERRDRRLQGHAPGALADAVMQRGGLGLARTIAENLKADAAS